MVNVNLNIVYTDGGSTNQTDVWFIRIPKNNDGTYRTCYGMAGDDVTLESISLESYTPLSDDTTIYEVTAF